MKTKHIHIFVELIQFFFFGTKMNSNYLIQVKQET